MDWELKVKYTFKIINEELICYDLITSIFTGGAHGNYWTMGHGIQLFS
jgi:hypothetical protein